MDPSLRLCCKIGMRGGEGGREEEGGREGGEGGREGGREEAKPAFPSPPRRNKQRRNLPPPTPRLSWDTRPKRGLIYTGLRNVSEGGRMIGGLHDTMEQVHFTDGIAFLKNGTGTVQGEPN